MSGENGNRIRRWIFLPAGLLCAGMIIAAKFRPPTGEVGPDALRFVGRLHMLALHLPIGLLLTLPALEILGWIPKFRALKESTTWVLGFGTLGAIVAAMMGYLLATNDGYKTSELLINHMWGGMMVASLSMLAFYAKIQHGAIWGKVYALFLLLICGVLPLAAHEGGSLTHGANYLTEFFKQKAPKTQPVAGQSLYAGSIQTIFNAHCVSCHGSDKAKGDLRLDSYEWLKKARPAILDKENSELVRRITLPATDDEAMPPDGKNPLSEKEVEAIKAWVEKGAGE